MTFVPKYFCLTKQGPNCSSCRSSGTIWQEEKRREAQRESESEVTQSCPTLFDPMDCSLPASSVHGIFLGRVLEWVAIKYLHLGPIRRERWKSGGRRKSTTAAGQGLGYFEAASLGATDQVSCTERRGRARGQSSKPLLPSGCQLVFNS